jgi:hypothetical protein
MRDHEHGTESATTRSPHHGRIQTPAVPLQILLRSRTPATVGTGGSVCGVLGVAGLTQLQRAAGNVAVVMRMQMEEERSPVLDVVNSGGGSPLDTATRTDMESRFGQDFGDVRVHTGGAAHESAQAVNAHAYTVGSNIVFQRDAYNPGSDAGRHTLAHELTHVIQQRGGPVDGTDAGGGIRISDPGDRFEREAAATADQVMSQPAPAVQRTEEAEEPE